jgi:hypothetical protein
MPATRQQKHEAGRHLVVGEALLRGYDAHTIGPTRLVEVNGHRAAVHVKTQTGLVHADGAHCWEHLLDPPTTALRRTPRARARFVERRVVLHCDCDEEARPRAGYRS